MSSKKDRDRGAVTYRRLYGAEPKGKRLSMVPGNYTKDGPGKSGEGGARPGLGGTLRRPSTLGSSRGTGSSRPPGRPQPEQPERRECGACPLPPGGSQEEVAAVSTCVPLQWIFF